MQNVITYPLVQKTPISEIVREYSSRLKSFIRNRVNSVEDAEDILQDVFYQLAEADQLMKPIEQISAWLYTVARNRITDLYRKNKPEVAANFATGNEEDDILAEMSDMLNSTDNSPETEYLKSLVWTELEKALDELPYEQRAVFEMNELQGISFKELAQITGETENTLISRKRYAVLHLRERLQVIYDELLIF
jgi:RNA polymerase sigma factor (sigma-70 family)